MSATRLTNEQLRALARKGAPYRLAELATEQAQIRAQFPELFGRRAEAEEARPARKPMSKAARSAASARMRKYWAERRKAEKAKGGAR